MNSRILPAILLGFCSLLAIQGCSSPTPKTDSEAIVRACELYFKGIKENVDGNTTILEAVDFAQLAQELATSGSDMEEYRKLQTEMRDTLTYADSGNPLLIGTMNRAEGKCNDYLESN